ncbi:MAG TPA: hypothetical protein VGI56_11950 [Galbitalea sp.]|jgi:hypothetical protein
MEVIYMRRLFGHIHLVRNPNRPYRWRLRNYTKQIHHQIVKLGQSVCPFCEKVL